MLLMCLPPSNHLSWEDQQDVILEEEEGGSMKKNKTSVSSLCTFQYDTPSDELHSPMKHHMNMLPHHTHKEIVTELL